MKYGYSLFKKNNVDKEIKYEVGKRYRFYSEHGFIDYNRRFDDVCHNFENCNYDKIYKIKIYDDNNGSETRDFKILQEINYKDLLNSKNKHEQFVSAIKNKEESVLNNFVKSDNYYEIKAIIKSREYKYIDIMIADKEKYFNLNTIISLIKKIGRNKDLNHFINHNNENIKSEIAKIGRPQDLDILINDKDIIVIENVLKNRRTKDIKKYIKNSFFIIPIIKTGIDKYLDFFIKDHNSSIEFFIAEQGRKCDLDILVHDKNESVRKAVARHGYDDHLNILKKENKPNINYIINELR